MPSPLDTPTPLVYPPTLLPTATTPSATASATASATPDPLVTTTEPPLYFDAQPLTVPDHAVDVTTFDDPAKWDPSTTLTGCGMNLSNEPVEDAALGNPAISIRSDVNPYQKQCHAIAALIFIANPPLTHMTQIQFDWRFDWNRDGLLFMQIGVNLYDAQWQTIATQYLEYGWNDPKPPSDTWNLQSFAITQTNAAYAKIWVSAADGNYPFDDAPEKLWLDNVVFINVPPTPTPTATHTPTPTATLPFCAVEGGYAGENPPACQALPLCQGVVNTTNQDGFGLRSGASTNSQLLARLMDGTAISILGRFYAPADDSTWFRVSYNGQLGWMRDDGVSYDLFTCGELEVLDGEGNTAIVSLATFDYELEPPDPSWETITCSASALGVENWRNCAKFVYFRYYHTFHAELERYPRLSDVIAAVYNGEMSSLYSEGVPDVGINPRNGIPKLDIAFEAISRNFWSVIVSHGGEDKRLTLNQLLEEYLVQVQSWYQLAKAGQPDLSAIARELVYEPLNYQPIANRVLQQEWEVTAESVRQWGNYPFNGPASDYNSLYTAQPIAYCITVRAFRDADGKLPALTRRDTWNDYRFALVIGSYGTVGTYNQTVHAAPAWLKQPDANNPDAYYRNTVVDTTPGDNAEGRVFLGCSEVIQALDPNSIPDSP